VILAGGKDAITPDDRPLILQPLGNRSILECVIQNALLVAAEDIYVEPAGWRRPEAGDNLPRPFGANAAWLRLAVMTHNVLTALKRLALPEKWITARPKRLRFQIFCSPSKLVSHARQTWLRVRRLKDQLAEWIATLHALPIPRYA
jgi:hypothetical protein